MTWQTALLVLLVVLWAVAQYGLAAHAILDLRRRPTVRGNNKVVWALVILGIPIAGALIYTIYGPTSFIRRNTLPTTSPANRSTLRPMRPEPDPDSIDRSRPGDITAPRLGSPLGRSTAQAGPHAQPFDRLPEIPELSDFDDDWGDSLPDPEPRRIANRLVRQAQRKIGR